MKQLFILRYPWALYDPDSRIPIDALADAESETAVHADWPFLLATSAEISVRSRNRRVPPQPEGRVFHWGPEKMRLYTIPMFVRRERDCIDLGLRFDHSPERVHSIRLIGTVPKPTLKAQTASAEQSSDDGQSLAALVSAMYARITDIILFAEQKTFDSKLLRFSWYDYAIKILEEGEEQAAAQMDIIVKHARELGRVVTSVAERPRQVLKRVRKMMPVTRIQQMDAPCLVDFIRRPGRSVAEKAGARQLLKGIDREQTFNTLENRVLKDVLIRSDFAARSYASAFPKSGKTALVRNYGMICRRLSRDQAFQDLPALIRRPTPNYVLLFDPLYQKIWKAYQELIKRDEHEDDAWRWQSRMWADIASLIVQAALIWACKDTIARSPQGILAEQHRGRWTEDRSQTTVFLMSLGRRKIVVSPIDLRSQHKHPRSHEWQASLGATMVLQLEECGGGRKCSLLLWACHSAGQTEVSVKDAVESAQSSLSRCLSHIELIDGQRFLARGVIVCSRRDMDAKPEILPAKTVTGVAFPPASEGLSPAVETVEKALMKHIEELFA